MHSTYAVVLSTRDPNIPCTTVPRQLPLESCDFSPTLYTFDTVVARPARVLRCVEREARGTRATTRYNKAKAPRVARVSVSMHTQRSLTSGHLHAQDEDAACCSQGRRVNYERFTICRRAEFVKIAITEDAKMRTLCKKLRNKNGAKKTLHFPSGLILPLRTSTVPVASKQTPAAPLFRLLRAQIPKSASHPRHIPFPPPCASSWRGAARTAPSHWAFALVYTEVKAGPAVRGRGLEAQVGSCSAELDALGSAALAATGGCSRRREEERWCSAVDSRPHG